MFPKFSDFVRLRTVAHRRVVTVFRITGDSRDSEKTTPNLGGLGLFLHPQFLKFGPKSPKNGIFCSTKCPEMVIFGEKLVKLVFFSNENTSYQKCNFHSHDICFVVYGSFSEKTRNLNIIPSRIFLGIAVRRTM